MSDLDERIAGHILHTLVRLVSKLEQLVDDSLEEFPMRLEETRILTDNVHDIRSAVGSTRQSFVINDEDMDLHDSLVVLPTLHLRQTKQIFDNGNEESLLRFFVHRSRNRPDSPAERVEISPRPF